MNQSKRAAPSNSAPGARDKKITDKPPSPVGKGLATPAGTKPNLSTPPGIHKTGKSHYRGGNNRY